VSATKRFKAVNSRKLGRQIRGMNLEFKCSADKVQAKAQKVLERYYGVLQSKRHMRQLSNNDKNAGNS
jgi:hypothetical protein